MGYSSIFWLPLCAVLTGIGLVASYYAGRRRGYRAMARGAAWSLIPIAAYLTGSIKMFWQIGDAIGNFATAFVFSPAKWAGIAVAAGAAALFLATGGRRRRKAARVRAAERAQQKKPASAATEPAGVIASSQPSSATLPISAGSVASSPVPARTPAKRAGKTSGAPLDDDMKDIEDILRKRGI
jgi:hypothetical protein